MSKTYGKCIGGDPEYGGSEDYSAPVMYTSYEDWTNFCDNDIVVELLGYKFKQLLHLEHISDEKIKALSYSVIESMQMMEKRDECFQHIDDRIQKRFNLKFPAHEINMLMTDRKIFYAAYMFDEKPSTKTKFGLDAALDYNLFHAKLPTETDSAEIKKEYKLKLARFKKDNQEFLIQEKLV